MFKKTVILLVLVALAYANYSQVLGERLARLSLASYCKRSDVEKWTCGPCKNSKLNMTNVKTFENSSMDTLGFIGISNQLNAIVLVFRGTLPWDLKNWISDINFITTAYPLCNYGCKVHRGFYDSFVDIKTQVLDEVALYKQKYNLENIIITGHSLGAALAIHAAAHLLVNGTKVTELYTFGLPRVGAPSFVTWFNEIFGKDHFKARVTHGRDPVPHLPMESWGFQHVGTEVFYKGLKLQGYEICKDDNSEDNKCSDKYKADVDVIDHLSYYEIDFGGLILACQA